MDPFQFFLIVLLGSIIAGVLGALLGLGGGIIIIPMLTLALGVDIHYAIGASIVSVIATSSGAAAAYVRDRITNLRIGMLLEITTTTGAVSGAFIAGLISVKVLYIIFAVVLAYSAVSMFRKQHDERQPDVQAHPWARRLRLAGAYSDARQGRVVAYDVAGVPLALALMYVAGTVSGLLGIGGGILKVPAMDMAMKLPMKVSTATSNFMIGVTAAASAGVYFARGDIVPFVAGPVALGVLIGATLGTHLMIRLNNRSIRQVFVVVLIAVAVQMAARGLGIGLS